MNEHDRNMQMQLNSSVNLGFLCARVCTWWSNNKAKEKQFILVVVFVFISPFQSLCWSRFQGEMCTLNYLCGEEWFCLFATASANKKRERENNCH